MQEKKEQQLFNDFPPVSTEAWMEKIKTDLKGADFEKRLVWRTNEGFNVRPFYRAEDLKSLTYLNVLPGEFPYIRGNDVKAEGWLVRQEIKVTDMVSANKKALELLTKGVTSLGFYFEDDTLITEDNISSLLEGINIEDVEINFEVKVGYKKLVEVLASLFNGKKKVKGSINFDPLGIFSITGKTCRSFDEVFAYAKEILDSLKEQSKFRTVSVNAKYFNNAGASIVQELAFALSLGNEYLLQLTEKGVAIDDVANNVKFNFGIGSNYFMEIAKLRAARLLWANIVEQYNPESKESGKMHIHCETSEWNKTIYDPYVNLLRTQTEAMSASLGGTQSLTVLPFDAFYKTPDDFSERIARNQQLLLKEESYFDKVEDVAAGSYYIENLTNSIATEAWKLFIETEDKGGYLSALKAGFIQKLIGESADKRRKAVATRRENFLGTNEYPNFTEEISAQIVEVKNYDLKSEDRDIEPITLFRGAEEFEALRLATEKAEKQPKVFMLTFGNLAMRIARSQFLGNFFGCAGYKIIDNNGFATVEEGVEAAKKVNADIVVLCSSDDEYADAAPKALELLNGEAILVVAGAPASMDELKAKGVEHFIHVRTNVLETLKMFNERLTQRHRDTEND